MKYLGFLQEADGGFSATRLGFLLWVIGTIIVWAVCSIKTATLLEIPSSVQVIIGILMTGKVVQKYGEKTSSPTDSLTQNKSST
ncbi:MAG: hypothetical protein P4N59_19415 [Negativicutes bacterium]|nr:hypothetical protein [Negativicutes bacterium]